MKKIIAVSLFLLILGCKPDGPPVSRPLPSGMGGLNTSTIEPDDWAGKGSLKPGIDFCSFAASNGIDDFVFFVWGDFNGGAGASTTKNKDGLQFHGYLRNDPENRNVEYAGETKDGKTGHVTIDGNKFDLANGTLFLVSARREYTVKQLKRDMTRFESAEELFKDFAKNDPEVIKFFMPSSPVVFIAMSAKTITDFLSINPNSSIEEIGQNFRTTSDKVNQFLDQMDNVEKKLEGDKYLYKLKSD